jgi:hypothetical protein
MFSGWLVAARHLPRNLAHARVSHSLQGFSPGMRTVLAVSAAGSLWNINTRTFGAKLSEFH